MILPDINEHKNKKPKILKTDINSNHNSLKEQLLENGEKMKDHNYEEMSHHKQGHIYG